MHKNKYINASMCAIVNRKNSTKIVVTRTIYFIPMNSKYLFITFSNCTQIQLLFKLLKYTLSVMLTSPMMICYYNWFLSDTRILFMWLFRNQSVFNWSWLRIHYLNAHHNRKTFRWEAFHWYVNYFQCCRHPFFKHYLNHI